MAATDTSPARSSLGYLRPYRRPMAMGCLMLLLTNVCFLGVPETLGRAIDAIKTDDHDTLVTSVEWLVGFAIATAASRVASRIWIFNAARSAEYDLRSELFGHLMTLSPSYFRTHPTGDVMSRLTNDVQTVRAMWGAGLLNLVNAVFTFVAVLAAMAYHDPVVTAFVILPFPMIYWIGQSMSRRIYRTQRAVQAELGTLSSRIQEDLGAIQVIKTYGLGDVRRTGFVAQSQKLLDENMEAAKVRIQLGPLLNAMASMGVAILIYFGGRSLAGGHMTGGEVVAFQGFIARLVWPTLTLGFMLALVQRGRASWSRLETLQDEKPEIADGASPALPVTKQPARVEVRDLTIKVGGANVGDGKQPERTLLDSVSFTLEPGTTTAVVGRTGGGKSTLVDALCRLVQVPAGTVMLDGVDVTTLPLESVRAQIGYAPQEAFLFSTTIADNIAMGYGGGSAIPAARARELERLFGTHAAGDLRDEPRVTTASTAAGLARDLAAMPEGLGTIVGERGITLSGGQRQRVALARALAAAPRLLVLDDSLSSVDAETERLILRHLRELIAGRTAVLISHRVAAIKDADQILVLDQGKIVERGTHAELLAAGGTYAALYQTQIDTEVSRPIPMPTTTPSSGGATTEAR